MNRVVRSANEIAAAIVDKNPSPEVLADLNRKFDMEFGEFCHLQEVKSLAVANGILTPEEGQYIYQQMGEQPSTFNGRPLPVKIAITKMMGELLAM